MKIYMLWDSLQRSTFATFSVNSDLTMQKFENSQCKCPKAQCKLLKSHHNFQISRISTAALYGPARQFRAPTSQTISPTMKSLCQQLLQNMKPGGQRGQAPDSQGKADADRAGYLFAANISNVETSVMIAQDDSRVVARVFSNIKLSTIASEIDESPEEAVARTVGMVLRCVNKDRRLQVNFTPLAYKTFVSVIEDVSSERRAGGVYLELMKQLQEVQARQPGASNTTVSKPTLTTQLAKQTEPPALKQAQAQIATQGSTQAAGDTSISRQFDELFRTRYVHFKHGYTISALLVRVNKLLDAKANTMAEARDALGVVDFIQLRQQFGEMFPDVDLTKYQFQREFNRYCAQNRISVKRSTFMRGFRGSYMKFDSVLQHHFDKKVFTDKLMEQLQDESETEESAHSYYSEEEEESEHEEESEAPAQSTQSRQEPSQSTDAIQEEVRNNLKVLLEQAYKKIAQPYARVQDCWKFVIKKRQLDIMSANDLRDRLGVVDFCRIKQDYVKQYNPDLTVKFGAVFQKVLQQLLAEADISVEKHVQLHREDRKRSFLLQRVLPDYYYVGSAVEQEKFGDKPEAEEKQTDQTLKEVAQLFETLYVKHEFEVASFEQFKPILQFMMDFQPKYLESIDSLRQYCGLVDITAVRKHYLDTYQNDRKVKQEEINQAIAQYVKEHGYLESDRISVKDWYSKQLFYTRAILIQFVRRDYYEKLPLDLVKKAIAKDPETYTAQLQISALFKSKFTLRTPEQMQELQDKVLQSSKPDKKAAIGIVDLECIRALLQSVFSAEFPEAVLSAAFKFYTEENGIKVIPELVVLHDNKEIQFKGVCENFATNASLAGLRELEKQVARVVQEDSQPPAMKPAPVQYQPAAPDSFADFFEQTFELVKHSYARIQFCWDKIVAKRGQKMPKTEDELRARVGLADLVGIQAQYEKFYENKPDKKPTFFFRELHAFIQERQIEQLEQVQYGNLKMHAVLPYYFKKGFVTPDLAEILKPRQDQAKEQDTEPEVQDEAPQMAQEAPAVKKMKFRRTD
ncbi:Hypothetical_protein [Hexamita inflata]|uniref:Hypothetical_protein n=1 Tax=Hexamita inflata TaxID=28002 RepID=A0AA86U9A5_9EUKA|nr:Hypothetical protein HINF_LOCUS36165 [Hexamita inflata]